MLCYCHIDVDALICVISVWFDVFEQAESSHSAVFIQTQATE